MPEPRQRILIVDDVAVNRMILAKILMSEYDVAYAENGRVALDFLRQNKGQVTAIILDLAMPVMTGYEFLEEFGKESGYRNIPVIVTTGNADRRNETQALKAGAWDFISKPYDANIIRFRLHNAIVRSQLTAFEQLKYIAEFDKLTGLYNRDKFYSETRAVLDHYPEREFDMLRLDIDRFQLVNSFFGAETGDKLIRYIADVLRDVVGAQSCAVYGHIEADVFALCVTHHSEAEHIEFAERFQERLHQFDLAFDLVPSVGVYQIKERSANVDLMYDRANLAAKKIKGSYVELCAFYTEKMSESLETEQRITNEMNTALQEEQFLVYLQPKYNLHNNLPAGAEALVRWKHPVKGMVSPGMFIPVFERNGFISKLDYYMWEHVCRLLRGWLDRGVTPAPVSVNVSRVNLYNPRLVETICTLVDRYKVPHELINLELTESAYTDNPQAIKETMTRLHDEGFVVMMDDFGSGYSSLNILKDLEVDIIKIDMRFFSQSEIPGRGENIIAAVVRMAKWLSIPTIAEGVETAEQVEFLRGIGCEYVQGFYFAKPMPVEDYEKLVRGGVEAPDQAKNDFSGDSIWTPSLRLDSIATDESSAVAIYEFANDHIELLRVNQAYYDVFGYEDVTAHSEYPLASVDSEFTGAILGAFHCATDTKGSAECEFVRGGHGDAAKRWVHLHLKYVSEIGGKAVLYGVMSDMTAEKADEQGDQGAKNDDKQSENRILIVDDVRVNRIVLQNIFAGKFETIEAGNGREAIEQLRAYQNHIDVILLDLNMPVMDGVEFLNYKKEHPEIADIPVIIITADNTPEQQVNTLALGANDYIVKPFLEEIVLRRVCNVLESNRRFRDMLREYNNVVELSQSDPLTHIYNRAAGEELIEYTLKNAPDSTHAFIMIDVDSFKSINDRFGHDVGDHVLTLIANKLKKYFRSGDVVARFGGDEFCILMSNVPSAETALNKCQNLCRDVAHMHVADSGVEVSTSVGVAVTDADTRAFATLYKNADQALYTSKRSGKNRVSLFNGRTITPDWERLDGENAADVMDDAVVICDMTTNEVVYESSAAPRMFGCDTCLGRKCHELFYGLDKPCESCIKHELNVERFRQWTCDNAHLGKKILFRGKLVRFGNRLAQMQVITDLTESSEKEAPENAKQ